MPVEAVDAGARHYRISDAMAPSDYGYNKIQLVPDSDGALIRLHLKGHAETGATGWTFGFVAVRNGTPRYGELTQGTDNQISFQTQPGEREVFLTVTGTPATAVPKYGFLDGWPKNRRYPYEFRISGAIPSGHEPGYTKPAATHGGRWHTNGGGWVAGNANVAASAYVGPRAAVFSGTVGGNARIEDLAWVNGGTVTGNAVVRGNAIIQGGATIGGTAVVGGDAEPPAGPTGNNCTSGTYLMFNPSRSCDGGAGEADVNPAHGTFTAEQLAITGGTPPTTPPPSIPPPSIPPPSIPPSSIPPTTSPTPTTAPPGGTAACRVAYAANSWSSGFTGDVTVTNTGSTPVDGWTLTFSFANGQQVTGSWNTTLTQAGSAVTAANVSHNARIAAGGTASFGFQGTHTGTNQPPTAWRLNGATCTT